MSARPSRHLAPIPVYPESYIYNYVVGGAIFLASLGLTVWRGDARMSRGEDRRTVWLLLGGMAVYAAVQGYFQFVVSGAGG